jgi:hypothetical protein
MFDWIYILKLIEIPLMNILKKSSIFKLITLVFFLFSILSTSAQGDNQKEEKLNKLYRSSNILSVKLKYSIKEIKRNTKDSIRTKSILVYVNEEGLQDSLNVTLETRGNYRLKKCYFPPVTIRIKKSQAKGTVFKGQKKLKLVMPCLKQKQANDYVIKEYIAYKIYELVSPYHFKTRLLSLEFSEMQGGKEIIYYSNAFLIEDDKEVAKRHEGRVVKSVIHPSLIHSFSEVRSSLFQYLIGNVDFTTASQHNSKLIYTAEGPIPLPYDFDFSGLVDASYAFVPEQRVDLGIIDVTQRAYQGYLRTDAVFQKVRLEFIEKKEQIFNMLESYESLFSAEKEYNDMVEYVQSFYEIIENDKRFKDEIISKAVSL